MRVARTSSMRPCQSDSALRASNAATSSTSGHARSGTEEGYLGDGSSLGDEDINLLHSRFSSPSSASSSIFPSSTPSTSSRRTSASPRSLNQIGERWEGAGVRSGSPRSTFYSARSSVSVWSTVSMAFGAFGVPLTAGGDAEEAAGTVRRSLCLPGVDRHGEGTAPADAL